MGATKLSDEDRQRIGKAIATAEAGHRGEIVVHVEAHNFVDPMERAAKLFVELGVDRTAEHTGVLLYIATATRHAAVWAGTGIRDADRGETWKPVFDALGKSSDPVGRICDAIAALGTILGTHASGADTHGNELGDAVAAIRELVS